MPIGSEEKQAIVAEVHATAGKALSAVLADYRGVSVGDMTQLRKQARAVGVQLRVVRNRLAKRAFEGTDFACMHEVLSGPSILAFSLEEPGAGARVFKAFAKENKAFEIKALSIGGDLLPAAQIDVLAQLPTRDQALSTMLAVMLAPVTTLARTLQDLPGRITQVVATLRDQKQSSAD